MRLFDTHAHYYADQYAPDRDARLAALPGEGVTHIVCPGCDLASSRASRDLAEKYPFFYFAAGIHPEDLEGVTLDDLREVEAMAAHPKCVAIGEIGLDYYWVKTSEARENSRKFFDAQLTLAEKLDKPVIVHDRDAHRDTMDIALAHPGVRGVLHCCTLSAVDAKAMAEKGWHISLTGNVTFETARRALEVIAAVPLDKLMIETDSPYMTPVPFRGRRNDSRYVYRVAETIARIKGLDVETVAEATFQNGLRFFGLGEG